LTYEDAKIRGEMRCNEEEEQEKRREETGEEEELYGALTSIMACKARVMELWSRRVRSGGEDERGRNRDWT